MELLKSGRKIPSLTLILFSVCSIALLAACGGTVAVTSSPFASNAANSQAIVTTLKHDPTGTADLSWNPENHQLTVKTALTGLAPSSSHMAHIHAGNCSGNGAIVYPLNMVVADAKGDAVSVTTINNVENGIPASGWYINVHNGTMGQTALDDRPIACGNIANSETSKDSQQSVHVVLGGTVAPNESASGQAVIAMVNGKLTLKITLTGLQPDSVHAAHIHAGSCAAQGPVVVMLNPVVADAHGIGTSITTLKRLPTSSGGLYVNVHTGASMSQLAQPTLFNPIACGNLPA